MPFICGRDTASTDLKSAVVSSEAPFPFPAAAAGTQGYDMPAAALGRRQLQKRGPSCNVTGRQGILQEASKHGTAIFLGTQAVANIQVRPGSCLGRSENNLWEE